MDKSAVAVLQHCLVSRPGNKRGPDALLRSSQTLKRLFPHVVGYDGVEEKLPIALAADPAVGMQDPDHWHAQTAELGRHPVDRFNDASRCRHLGRTAWSAERVLHVDYDQRRAGGVQSIEQMVTAAALQDAIDDFLADRNGMHESNLSGARADATPARRDR